jgi:4-alpha-glucanotransferase
MMHERVTNPPVKLYEDLIEELAEHCGIIPEYWDILGNRHVAPLHSKREILRAMRINVDSADDVQSETDRLRWEPWKGFLDPVHVLSSREFPVTVPLYLPLATREIPRVSITWSVEFEDGKRASGRLSGEQLTPTQELSIEDRYYTKSDLLLLPHGDFGYHTLTVECRDPKRGFPRGASRLRKTARLILTPDQCYLPPEFHGGRRWGLSVNLYALRSSRNWGVGDLADLTGLAAQVAGLGGSLVGINPLHATPNSRDISVSPYYTVSRLYKNFIYLDIEGIPEVRDSDLRGKIARSRSLRKKIDQVRTGDLIDYDGVAALKHGVLKDAFALFRERHFSRNTSRARRVRGFIAEEGAPLQCFALFSALSEHLTDKEGTQTWKDWPPEYRRPDSPAVAEFMKTHSRDILFHQFVQWLIDEALSAVREEAAKAGLDVGLYHDLAIGSIGGGSDVWNYQELFGDAEVGAPPDDFSQDGQNWGFPPLIPRALKNDGYELFIQTLRENMRHFGALRIDHALGLFRLFWIPRGMTAKDGVYVRYPSEDLLKIIALESVRNRTVIVAEDLGTIGERVREELLKHRMLSYRLLYFERYYPEPSFTRPEHYPEMSLCAVSTHDLPTLSGYWSGHDLKTREELGLLTHEEAYRQQVSTRERDKSLILSALAAQGLLPGGSSPEDPQSAEMTPALCLAIYHYLSRTPCKILLVSLDDLIGTLMQQNMPGVTDLYPNWMQKTSLTLEEIVSDARLAALAQMLGATRSARAIRKDAVH